MLSAYNKALTNYPIITKMITSGTLFSLGDYITQAVVDRKQKIDWIRNRNLFIVGATYLAPMLHLWYCKVLPRLGNFIFKQTTPKAVRVITSMGFDQLLFAPIFLSGFFIFDGIVKNFSLEGVKNGIRSYRQKIWQTMKINWMIWPIASTINFSVVPVQYQVLFANFVGLFWNVILSYIANDQKSPSQKAAESVV